MLLADHMVPVLPLNPDKSPASHLGARRGVHSASTYPREVERWRARSGEEPGGVGIAAGRSEAYRHGLVVVDLDRHGAADGVEVWDGLDPVQRLGWTVDEAMERTLVTRTRSGGYHLWFAMDPGLKRIRTSQSMLGPAIDVVGSGYVCAPPSPGYEFVGSSDVVAPIPDWLLGATAREAWERKRLPGPRSAASSGPRRRAYAEKAVAEELELMAHAPEGRRHSDLWDRTVNLVRVWSKTAGDIDTWLARLAGVARGTDLPDDEVAETIRDARAWAVPRFPPTPLPEQAVDRSAERAVIDDWRVWWANQDTWTGSVGITRRAVAEAILEVAELQRHRHFTLAKSDLALLTPTSSPTVRRVVKDLTGFMFEEKPGDGIKATEFTLLDAPRVDDTPTRFGAGGGQESSTTVTSGSVPKPSWGVTNANPPGDEARIGEETMPSRHHDAFAREALGLIGWPLLALLHQAPSPLSTNEISKHLAVSWSAANKALTGLLEVEAVVGANDGWVLEKTPAQAADLLAAHFDTVGWLDERLGSTIRERGSRKHSQAMWAADQKDPPSSPAG